MKEINIVVGEKGSGKSSVLEIVNTFGFYTTELSTQCKCLQVLGFERNEKPGEWNASLISLVYNNLLVNFNSFPIFMSGFSRLQEIEFIRDKGFDTRVIKISAPLIERYNRIIIRGRLGEKDMNIEEFHNKDLRRLGLVEGYTTNDLKGLLDLATYSIDNSRNFEDLVFKVKEMLNKFNYIR